MRNQRNIITYEEFCFVMLATALTIFFGLLVVAMITGFKAVESGNQYNNVVMLCILAI